MEIPGSCSGFYGMICGPRHPSNISHESFPPPNTNYGTRRLGPMEAEVISLKERAFRVESSWNQMQYHSKDGSCRVSVTLGYAGKIGGRGLWGCMTSTPKVNSYVYHSKPYFARLRQRLQAGGSRGMRLLHDIVCLWISPLLYGLGFM